MMPAEIARTPVPSPLALVAPGSPGAPPHGRAGVDVCAVSTLSKEATMTATHR